MSSPARRSLPRHGRMIASRFVPHPLLRHAHQQTIGPMLLRPMPRVDMRIERMETPDGDFVDLGWVGEHNVGGPVAVLVHGLGGGFDSKYLRGVAQRLEALGWRSVMLQLRGGGAEPNRLPRAYHHGDTVDLRLLWRRLRECEPEVAIAAVGWSMGGNIVLRALAEEGARCPVSVAVAASVPFRLRECAEHLDTGFARVYQRHLMARLKEIVRSKHAAYPIAGVDLQRVLATRSFIEFDNAFTAPLNGFADAYDYYERTACGNVLRDIRVPTLIVHAQDDPFMRPEIVPPASALSPSVTLELAQAGGHVGFIGKGALGQLDWWLERHVVRHLKAAIGPVRAPDAAQAPSEAEPALTV